MTREEMRRRRWDELDVVIVTGDAYVDHPSFPAALLGRLMEREGLRVGVIARPRTDTPDDVARLGHPRLFFALAPGAVDSMINNYTAQKRKRRSDEYAPGGHGGERPNRAAIVYANLIRRVFGKNAGILAGGIEVSLRRFAHYDFWDDAVRRPILLDMPADAMVYGMGEKPLLDIIRALRGRAPEQAAVRKIAKSPAEVLADAARRVRGVVYRAAASETPPPGCHALPSFESVRDDPQAQVRAYQEEARHRTGGVYQDCAGYRVIANPPPEPLTVEEMDRVYALPFARRAHPSYRENVPALDQVQFSVTSHRGCFGGCAFCGISTHQGKIVQSRSRESILREVREIAAHPDFKGTIRDIGGATANMWQLHCRAHRGCDRPSCLAPEVCRNLETCQRGYVALLEEARKVPGVRHVFISSGIRMDLALECEPFIEAFARRYTSGHAKVAPEHVVPEVLRAMMKPEGATFVKFLERFREASRRAGKEQYVLPYFIAGHPGSRIEDMIEVALFLKRERIRVEQCQIFTPIPGTASAVMYATGINPFTGKRIFVERSPRRRDMQKALVLCHLPESAKLVREALNLAHREHLAPTLLASAGRGYHARRRSR